VGFKGKLKRFYKCTSELLKSDEQKLKRNLKCTGISLGSRFFQLGLNPDLNPDDKSNFIRVVIFPVGVKPR